MVGEMISLRINIFLFFIFLIVASTQIGFCQDSATIKIMNDSLSNLNNKIDSMDLATKRQMLETETELKDNLNEIKSVIYNQGIDEIEGRKSSISIMASVGGVFVAILALIFSVMMFLTQRSRDRMDKEIGEIRERRLAIDKIYDEIISRERKLRKQLTDLDETLAVSAKKTDRQAVDKEVTLPEEKIRLIEESEAEKSIEEFEKIYHGMIALGLSEIKLPLSLLRNVSKNYMRLKKYKKALINISVYLESNPKDGEMLLASAACYNYLYDENKDIAFLNDSIKMLRKSIEVNPRNEWSYYNWGVVLGKLYNERDDISLLESAIEKYRKVIEINSKNDLAYVNWGNTLSRLYDKCKGNIVLDDVIDKYRKAIEINPKNDSAYFNWGVDLDKLFDKCGDFSLLEDAVEKCRQAVDANPVNESAYVNWGSFLGKLYDKNKDISFLDEAIERYRKAIEINPENDSALYGWSGILIKMYYLDNDTKYLNEAKKKANKALQVNAEDKSPYYNIACAESLLKNKQAMLDALKISIDYDFKNKKLASEDKDFEKYWDDPGFIALTKED